MTTHHFAAAGTGVGFRRQMHDADFAAFRRWHDARSLLFASRAERDATFSRPARRERKAMSPPLSEAA